jgi:hypothetical protein
VPPGAIDLTRRVAIAVERYAPKRSDVAGDEVVGWPALKLAEPLAFALGWIVACELVTAFHAEYGLDVIPHGHPERGWDRFYLTRQAPRSGSVPIVVGELDVGDDSSPSLTLATGEKSVVLRDLLLHNPERAVAAVLDRVRPSDPLGDRGSGSTWEQHQRVYPLLFAAAAELVLEHPGTIVARELFVDDEPISGAFHPLFLHGDGAGPQLTYDWILVQQGERCTFIRTDGSQVIFERAAGVWAAVVGDLSGKTFPDIKNRIEQWLRLESDSVPTSG